MSSINGGDISNPRVAGDFWGDLVIEGMKAEEKKNEERRNSGGPSSENLNYGSSNEAGSIHSTPSSSSSVGGRLFSPFERYGIPSSFPIKPAKHLGSLENALSLHKRTAEIFDRMIDHCLVSAFFKKWPKSGDEHCHLTGSVYPVDIMVFAEQKNLFIDTETYLCFRSPFNKSIKVVEFFKDYANREAWKGLISMHGDNIMNLSGKVRFFSACTYGESVLLHVPMHEQLEKVVTNAKSENIGYLEVMIEYTPERPKNSFESDFNKCLNHLSDFKNEGSDKLGPLIERYREDLTVMVAKLQQRVFRDFQNADEIIPEKVGFDKQCPITSVDSPVLVRYILEVNRNQEPYEFFLDAFAAYSLAKTDPRRIGGVNIVGPEDDMKAMKYYDEQIGILQYLSKTICFSEQKRINLSIHAGELDPETSDSSRVSDRIKKVLKYVQGIKRIGHGFSIYHDSEMIYADLKERDITIEACPWSSFYILNSLPPYFKGGKSLSLMPPITINTDDQGITLKSLSAQYSFVWESGYRNGENGVEKFRYRHFVRMNRQTLHSAFLEGESLYEKVVGGYLRIRPEFANILTENWVQSDEQFQLMKKSEKLTRQVRFERALLAFERNIVQEDEKACLQATTSPIDLTQIESN